MIVADDADLESERPGDHGIGLRRGRPALPGRLGLRVVGDEARQARGPRGTCEDAAEELTTGAGADPGTDVCPMVSPEARERAEAAVATAEAEGAEILLDGRIGGGEAGAMLGPTLVAVGDPESELAREEIFGPVLALVGVPDLDAAIEFANGSRYGNAGSIFTTSGAAARAYRWGIEAGMLGVNVGVPAPVAWFPFSGWKDSIDGDLHANGTDAVDFYTRKKVVTAAGSGHQAAVFRSEGRSPKRLMRGGRSWPRPDGDAHHESTVRRLGGAVPAAARVRAIVARVSAGSMTSSISKI